LATPSVTTEQVTVKTLPGTKTEFYVKRDSLTGNTFWYTPSDSLFQTPIYQEVINPKTGNPALKKVKK
jgi:hypothetical protein